MSARGGAWFCLLLGCATGRAPAPRDGAADPPLDGYRLGPEDVVEVVVWNNDALSRKVPVRPDGMISLPLVNDVLAAGLTPMELRDTLVARFTRFVDRPEVSVIVQEIHSPKVLVVGEVGRPGRYELAGPTTVLDILAHAGGLSEFAERSRIVVMRREASGVRRIAVDEREILKSAVQPVYLRPGDVVIVP